MLVKGFLRKDLHFKADSNTYYLCDPGQITSLLLAVSFIWKWTGIFLLGWLGRSNNTCEVFPGPDTRHALRNVGCYCNTKQLYAYCWYILPPNSEKTLRPFRSRQYTLKMPLWNECLVVSENLQRIHEILFKYVWHNVWHSGFVNFSGTADGKEATSPWEVRANDPRLQGVCTRA